MKALLLLMILSISAPLIAGPRVVGNGGGGVRENGVYKTFYSAGLYINPEAETEIPGAELYTKTILSLTGEKGSTSSLLSSALPIGDRKFYKILEDKMDATVMDRLIEEYARVVKQPKDNLTIFAITDIALKATYLLPSFYKLSEVEQAAILFHEGYWVLNPQADYAEVVAAESSFQQFVELKEAGKFDLRLPRLLGKLLNDPSLPLKSAFAEDVRSQKVADIITPKGTIKLKYLMANDPDLCVPEEGKSYSGKTMFGNSQYKDKLELSCRSEIANLQTVIAFSKKYPQSFFIKELINFITINNLIRINVSKWLEMSSGKELTLKALNTDIYFNKLTLEDYNHIDDDKKYSDGYDRGYSNGNYYKEDKHFKKILSGTI